MLQHMEQQMGSLLGASCHLFGPNNPTILINSAVLSSPQSGLSSSASGSKRKRSGEDLLMALPQACLDQCHQTSTQLRAGLISSPTITPVHATFTTSMQLPQEDIRWASTSGRPAPMLPLAQDLDSLLYQHKTQLDALIRLQCESLRLGLNAARERHYGGLLPLLEQRVAKRLKEKETELENTRRRNSELEHKIKQISAENELWFEAARNSEVVVSRLREKLEQVLIDNAAAQAREECGDSEDDAQSCCFQADEQQQAKDEPACQNACRACRAREVAVLLLPCRHLCFCTDCEPKIDTCPICQSVKYASLQVLMS